MRFIRRPVSGSMMTHPGVYCLRSNQTDWDEATLWRTYFTLTDLEAVFRSLKSELGLRPIYHHKPIRADGHLFITVIAYQLVQVIRRRLRESAETASWTLRRILEGQQRITATFRRCDGRTLHVRNPCEAPQRDLRCLGRRLRSGRDPQEHRVEDHAPCSDSRSVTIDVKPFSHARTAAWLGQALGSIAGVKLSELFRLLSGDGAMYHRSIGEVVESDRGTQRVTRNASSYRPSFPNPSSTTTSRSVGPLRPVDSAMAGPMSPGSVMRIAVTPIARASPVKSIAGSLNSMPV